MQTVLLSNSNSNSESCSFNLQKTGIGEVIVIFFLTVKDPPGLQGLKN